MTARIIFVITTAVAGVLFLVAWFRARGNRQRIAIMALIAGIVTLIAALVELAFLIS